MCVVMSHKGVWSEACSILSEMVQEMKMWAGFV